MQNTEPKVVDTLSIDVAVGIIIGPSGKILISQRDGDQHLAGCWEFPGGKVDKGESFDAALRRELQEETFIQAEDIISVSEFQTIRHDYAEKAVCLRVFKVEVDVHESIADFRSPENKLSRWVTVETLQDYTFPEANTPIIEQLVAEHESR